MNVKSNLIWHLIISLVAFVYSTMMITLLNNTKRCDRVLPKSDRDFRKVALLVSYINAVLFGFNSLAIFVNLIAGDYSHSVYRIN